LTSCKPVSFSRRTLHHGVSKYAFVVLELFFLYFYLRVFLFSSFVFGVPFRPVCLLLETELLGCNIEAMMIICEPNLEKPGVLPVALLNSSYLRTVFLQYLVFT